MLARTNSKLVVTTQVLKGDFPEGLEFRRSVESRLFFDPRRNLRLPTEILAAGITPWARQGLYDLVWAFREAHGVSRIKYLPASAKYQAAVQLHSTLNGIVVPKEERDAVRMLSIPRNAEDIRHGGRNRRHYNDDIKDQKVLRLLCREIRATLNWRLKYPSELLNGKH
ncbi:MAG: hypothetical protein DCC75_03830 [Proteobacteria bacterium]|nr:MAG: hypothetical protein DCC75_03830 [Pseudomonadota bacterium]